MAPLPPKPVDLDGVAEATRQLLIALGQGDKHEVMRDTPRRVAELYQEWFNPPNNDIEDDFRVFDSPGYGDEGPSMVIVNDVHYTSLCEHHLMPAFGVAHVAYVPNQRVAGYSKLKKALNYVTRQPQLNERIVKDAADFLEERLQPQGLAIVSLSVHCCIGVRTNAPMQEIVTVEQHRGLLRDERYRAEFRASWTARKPIFIGA